MDDFNYYEQDGMNDGYGMNDGNGMNEEQDEIIKNSKPNRWNKKKVNRVNGISYSDILANMSMVVVDGKLKLLSKNANTNQQPDNNAYWNSNQYSGQNRQSNLQSNPNYYSSAGGMQQQYGGYGNGNGNGYGNGNGMQQQQQPISQEEYNRRLRDFVNSKIAYKKNVESKSKKMMFYNNVSGDSGANAGTVPISIQTSQARPAVMKQFMFRK